MSDAAQPNPGRFRVFELLHQKNRAQTTSRRVDMAAKEARDDAAMQRFQATAIGSLGFIAQPSSATY